MSRPKRHHYLPEFYLRCFADDSGLVWTYDRARRITNRLPPRVIAAENDFYTLPTEDPRMRTLIEVNLANLVEGPVAPILRKLDPSFHPTRQEVEHLAMFASFQKVRVPGALDQVGSSFKEMMKEFTRSSFETVERVEETLASMRRETGEQHEADPQELVDLVRSGNWDIEVGRHVLLKTMLDLAINMAPVLLDLEWTLLFAAQGRAFITSDAPFVIVPPRGLPTEAGVGVITPYALKYLPLTERVCLRMGDPGGGLSVRTVDGAVVRAINANIAANSDRFILANNEPILRRAIKVSATECASDESRSSFSVVEGPMGGKYFVDTQLSKARHYHDGM